MSKNPGPCSGRTRTTRREVLKSSRRELRLPWPLLLSRSEYWIQLSTVRFILIKLFPLGGKAVSVHHQCPRRGPTISQQHLELDRRECSGTTVLITTMPSRHTHGRVRTSSPTALSTNDHAARSGLLLDNTSCCRDPTSPDDFFSLGGGRFCSRSCSSHLTVSATPVVVVKSPLFTLLLT